MYVLDFKIELKSDYHIASGTGLGSWCDSTLLRDQAGSPYIPGSSLAGLLRQGARDLLEQTLLKKKYNYCGMETSVDNCKKGDKPCIMCYLFGSPKYPGRLGVSTAVPDMEQGVVSEHNWGKDSSYRYRSSVDVRTRRAREKHLFGREEGTAAQVFSFRVDCPDLVSASFVVAAARMVRGFGSGRRRGSGDCLLHAIKIEPSSNGISSENFEKDMLSLFNNSWVRGRVDFNAQMQVNNQGLETKNINLKTHNIDQNNSKNPWRARLVVHLEEPLLVSRRGETGASFESFEGIPGSTLAGALLARSFKNQSNGSDESTLIELIRQGKISIPFLTLAKLTDVRLNPALSAPLNLAGCKKVDSFSPNNGEHPPVNRLVNANNRCACGYQLEEPGGMLILQASPFHHQPVKRLETHIHINPLTGRVPEDSLYRYIVLTEDQWLIGDILCDSEETWSQFKTSAAIPDVNQDFELLIGKAWRKGYGRCRAAVAEEGAAKVLTDSWIGVDIKNRVGESPEKDQQLTMTLLTDTIIPDRWGRFLTSLDEISTLESELRKSSNCSVISIKEIGLSFSRSRPIDSFNTRSGLPRSRDIALMAGSTIQFVINFDDQDILSCLQQIEVNGIGLRRTEGFGRVAFNHPLSLIGNTYNFNRQKVPESLLSEKQTQKESFEWLEQYILSEYQESIGGFITDKTADNWTAFARILRSSDNLNAAEEKLGKVPAGVAGELEHRDKKHFFEDKDKGKKGIEKLQEIWDEINQWDKWENSKLTDKARERLMAQHLAALISSVAAAKRRDG